MKLVVGKASEGKTNRLVELAGSLAPTMKVDIFTFEDSLGTIKDRLQYFMAGKGLDKIENVNIHQVWNLPVQEVMERIKESKANVVMVDGLSSAKSIKAGFNSIIDAYDKLNEIEKDSSFGIIASAQRSRKSNINGINVIDYRAAEENE